MPASISQQHQWKASAPVIAEGKVVFTAPDARSIHCVNLRDGSPVWSKPKSDDDLYLGNVYNGKVLIVGKRNVRGLSLNNGETLWAIETGTPSGQGIGSDNIYYLPLKKGNRGNEPQICAIDMDKGRIFASSPSRPHTPNGSDFDVPGNLLFYEGDVISMTHREVVVYPQLKVKIAEMDERIAKNPNDPIGLTERGDLRLGKGDLPGAIEDLSAALKQKDIDPNTSEKARGKLYDTLTAYVSARFNEAEKYLDEYEKLCTVDIKADLPPDEVKKLKDEERRRKATFLWLVGKGREEQGRLVEAFEKYSQFGAVAGKQQELVPAVDERAVKAAPDVWSRGRIIAMMAKAKPEHRAPLEKLIADKWDKLRATNDLNALRQFVRMFGSVSVAGKEARLELVERLMDQKESPDEHPLLEAELELNQFRTGQHPPELAGRATEALARLYVRKGLLEDAAYCYRKLGKQFGKIQIRDGKTGSDYFNDTATDKRLLPYLDEPDPFGSVKFDNAKRTDGKGMPGQIFQFEHQGEDLPYFRRHSIGMAFVGGSDQELKLIDRASGEADAWSPKLTPSLFQTLSAQVLGGAFNQRFNRFGQPIVDQSNDARFPYRTLGHLVVLPAGTMVYGIDPVNHRVLWEKDLTGFTGPVGPNGPLDQMHPPVVDPRDGTVLVTYGSNSYAQRLGQTGPLEGQTICVQIRDTLTALDPLTGRILWSRMDISPRNYLFADEEYVFVVELNGDTNKPKATHVFRAADGIRVKEAPDFSAIYDKRLQVFGRHILLSEPGAANGVTLRLHDALTGKDVWTQTYPARSLVLRGDDAYFTGVVEPDGKVHVVDLRERKEVMTGQMDEPSENLRNVQTVRLLADSKYFYVACQAPMAANNNPWGNNGVFSNVMTNLGMRTIPVNGTLFSFERGTGERAWYAKAENQMLVLEQFEESPIVLLTSRRNELRNNGIGRQQWLQVASVISIEKRTGKSLLQDGKDLQNGSNFWGVRIDPRAGTVDFHSPNVTISHFPKQAKAGKLTKPAASAPPQATPQAQPANGDNVKRAKDIERLRIREIATPIPPE
jgi:outer membrane protein assembly factor BamB/tetratricopeptide (TPR) repeat protein